MFCFNLFRSYFFFVENICSSWWLGILIGNTSFSNIFYVLGDWLCFRCQNETVMASIVRCVMSCDKMWFAGISVYTKECVCVFAVHSCNNTRNNFCAFFGISKVSTIIKFVLASFYTVIFIVLVLYWFLFIVLLAAVSLCIKNMFFLLF